MPNPLKELQEARTKLERLYYLVLPLEHRSKVDAIDLQIKNALEELHKNWVKKDATVY